MNAIKSPKKYVGIDNDLNGGMTDSGKIIRDAWVFEIIPETATCEGWLVTSIQSLWEKTSAEWGKYGFLVSGLPEEVRQRFERIQNDAMKRAKIAGWDPEKEVDEDS